MILFFMSYGTQRRDERMYNCVLESDIMNITLAKHKRSRKEQANKQWNMLIRECKF